MTARLGVLEDLLRAIEQELSLVGSDRTTGATDTSLASAAATCQGAISALQGGQGSVAADVLRRLAHMAVDEWSLGAQLTLEVTECAQSLGG